MRCRSVLTRVDALRTTELQANEAHDVESHLRTCRSCRHSVEDVKAFAAAIRSLSPRALPRVPAAPPVADSFDVFVTASRRVFVAFTPRGIRMIDVRPRTEEEFRRSYRARFGRELHKASLPPRERRAVESALEGHGAKNPSVDLEALTAFERDVLSRLLAIPRGEVRTYEWVARAAGRPKAVRAVGHVMATNPVPFLLPCHRVVPTAGGIGNYGFGPEMKRVLLAAEGAPVAELEACAKRRVRYVGSKTTRIFCFPTCHDARRIRETNRVDFHGAREAQTHGYRPCKRCRPVVAA